MLRMSVTIKGMGDIMQAMEVWSRCARMSSVVSRMQCSGIDLSSIPRAVIKLS
jgi:hypothetical protein